MWYYAKDGGREGPVSLDELRGILNENVVPLTTVVWTEGMDQWRPAYEVPQLGAGGGGQVVQPTPGMGLSMGAPQSSGMAVASMVLGLAGLLFVPIVCSIAAVICGHMARSQIRQGEGRVGGDGMAMTGLITGYLGLVIYLVLAAWIVVWISQFL